MRRGRGSGSHGVIIAPEHDGSLPVMCVFWCLCCRSRDSARANPALVARRVGSAESSSGATQRSNVTVGGQHTSPPQDGPLNQLIFHQLLLAILLSNLNRFCTHHNVGCKSQKVTWFGFLSCIYSATSWRSSFSRVLR